MKIDYGEARLLAEQYSSVDIEGFLDELIDWRDGPYTKQVEKNIIDVVIDVFSQYLGE